MKVFKVPGKVRKWIAIFTRHFFMKIFKVPGKVPIARALSKKQWMLTGGSAKMLLFGLKCRNLRVFLQFCWNVEIYALCRILAEMLRFTRFPRQKLSAARHLKLFCTPGDDVPILGAMVTLYRAMGNCCFDCVWSRLPNIVWHCWF